MKNKFNIMLVTKPENIRYLTGFTGEGALVLELSPQPPLSGGAASSWQRTSRGFWSQAVLITDSRYELRARQELKRGIKLAVRSDKSDDVFRQSLRRLRTKKLGFESRYVTVASLTSLKKKARGLEMKFISTENVIEAKRRVKTPVEIKKIAKACRITGKVLQQALERLKQGVTELEIVEEIRRLAFRLGAEDLAFDSIVAFGRNSATPHAKPDRKKLKRGDVIQFDLGIKVDGYCSDMSRVFFTAEPTPEQRYIYEAVLAAEEAGVRTVRAGVRAKDVDQVCREVLSEAGRDLPTSGEKPTYPLDQYFTHSTGHGVGLEIHEWPNLNKKSKDILVSRNVVTVEPGVYLENKFGMRIEDTVVVEKRGAKILTNFPKKIQVLKI